MLNAPNRAWLALVALATAAAVAATPAGATRISEKTTISYTIRNSETAYLTRTGLAHAYPGRLTTGDQIFSQDTLLEGAKTIGYDNEVCTVTFDGNDLCHVISVFAGRGEVDATWLWARRNNSFLGPHRFSGVIDGGTGTYASATGQFEATVSPRGTLEITATLN